MQMRFSCFPVLFADTGLIVVCYSFETPEAYLFALEAVNARW